WGLARGGAAVRRRAHGCSSGAGGVVATVGCGCCARWTCGGGSGGGGSGGWCGGRRRRRRAGGLREQPDGTGPQPGGDTGRDVVAVVVLALRAATEPPLPDAADEADGARRPRLSDTLGGVGR